MATFTNDDPHEIQMDGGSEDASEMDIDEFYSSDVDSNESDDELVRKEQSVNRNWSKTAFEPHLFHFNEQTSGASSTISAMKSDTLDFFELLFDEKMIDTIVEQTNKYHDFYTNDTTHNTVSHQAKWIPTNRSEIYTFLATIMLMAVTKKNKILDYWSTDPMIVTPMIGQLFSRDRFLMLLKYLHFSNKSNQVEGDRLHKIKPVINELRKKFKLLIIPYKNVCIDESLFLWKGRLAFKQFIPTKRHRFGIKVFVICDCQTGVVLDFIVYAGSSTEFKLDKNLGKSGSVVMTLMKPYLNKGHSLFLDNWYTSPRLFEKLHEFKTGACGTVRKNRLGPVKFSQLTKGDFDYNNTNILMALKWQDRREVIILSTIHKPKMFPTRKNDWKTQKVIAKPECIIDFNENMGSVDKTDMQISFIECVRKTAKWYKKFFFHLLDLSTLNAYILFKVKHKNAIQFGDFRTELIRQLIERYAEPNHPIGRPIIGDNPIRLTARHFPSPVPATATGNTGRRACIVCNHTSRREKKNTNTRY